MVQEALEDSRRRTAELLEKMQRARDAGSRIDREGLEIHYDREDDYLTVTVGSPRESVSVPAGPIYLLVDPDDGELSAMEIPFFVEAWTSGKVKGEFWDLAFRLIKSGHDTVFIPAKRELESAGEAFKDLVAVG